MGYVIKRLDQGGGYVAPSGSKSSYTKSIAKARIFATKDQAQSSKCDNEIVISVNSILRQECER